MRLAGHVARMGKGEAYTWFLMGKAKGKRTLGRPERRGEDNIKMDLQEVGWRAWAQWSWLWIGTVGGHL